MMQIRQFCGARKTLRIFFLSKRSPQQRDLIERPYGRFYNLPKVLAALGHEVHVSLCSHRHAASSNTRRDGVQWLSNDLSTLGTQRLLRTLSDEAQNFRPDWVIGCSDAWYGWLAERLAQRTGARLAIDAYDNYEAYMPWNLPLHWAWRRAVRVADLVTAAGPQLAERLQRHRRGGRRIEILPMAADPDFMAIDRKPCRAILGLPDAAPLIGYSGGWGRKRGTGILLEAFQRVQAFRPDARLVLSGSPPTEVQQAPGVIALGYLDDAQLPTLLNALDVACVITSDTPFGRYSYPAKLCEAMACGVPIVATATEPVRWMLSERLQFLADVGHAEDIASRLLANLDTGRVDYGSLPSWQQAGQLYEELLFAGMN